MTYASHSLFKTPGKDVAGVMDYVMCNEYVGSWHRRRNRRAGEASSTRFDRVFPAGSRWSSRSTATAPARRTVPKAMARRSSCLP